MLSSKDVYEMDNTIRLVYLLMSAVSILKDKKVDVDLILETFSYPKNGLKAYNSMLTNGLKITQEEYDLLKEVSCNETH